MLRGLRLVAALQLDGGRVH